MARIRIASPSSSTGPLSRRGKTKELPAGCGVIFGLLFFLPGLAVAYFLGIRPLLQVLAAQRWTPTPATVLASRVKTHNSSDGATYSIYIEYTYAWIETTHTSTRYDFSSGSSSGRESKQRVVRQYPVGGSVTAWVNPDKPDESVLDRSVKPFYIGMLAFGGVFMLVGGGISIAVLKSRKSAGAPAPSLPAGEAPRIECIPMPPATDAAGTLVLKPSTGPWMKVLGMLFITLFWNGIVSVFAYKVWQDFARGRPEWPLLLFLIPFLVVGILFVFGLFHALLATANPRVILLIGPGNPRCGGRFTLDWEFLGPTHRLRDFKLILEGVERATYGHGTNTRTDEHVFHRSTLARREAGQPMENGTIPLEFPADLPHSFQAARNRIEWRLVVHGDILKWPDLDTTYPIVLLPFDGPSA